MSSYSFSEEWSGRGARGGEGERHGHRHEEGRHGRHGGERGESRQDWNIADVAGLAGWAMAQGKGKGRGRHRPTPEEVEELMALRRMRGGPFGGPGFFGRGPGGRGPGGRGRGRARRGDVRLALLRLLAEEPRNGYQLMQTIEERSGGRWRPSPGSVYPTLAQLEDEGLVRSTEADGARSFEITDAGREHLESRTEEPAPWESDDGDETSARDLKAAIGGIAAASWQVASVGDERQRAQAIQVLAETRRSLYRILAEDASGAEGDDGVDDVDNPEAPIE
jgi:DNA-binding PadR family transcriptional regulator